MGGRFNNEADEAKSMVRALVDGIETECRETAMKSVGRSLGLSKWTVWALAYGRRKSVAHSTMQALRSAYLDYCERQLKRFEAELQTAKMRENSDAAFSDLGREATALVEKLRKARQRPE